LRLLRCRARFASGGPNLSWALLLRTTGLAFLGGLLLNLMPCVFPVLFLKGLALVHSGTGSCTNSGCTGWSMRGILVSFWALVAVLLGCARREPRWLGFQFQSPIFLALMAGFSSFWGCRGWALRDRPDADQRRRFAGSETRLYGQLFHRSTGRCGGHACTAPFMGAAIGYALSAPPWSPLPSLLPLRSASQRICGAHAATGLDAAAPKPGAWMEVLRQAVSIPIFATVIGCLVLAQAYGAGVLAALLASFLLLAIAGWFLGRWPAKRWATVVAGLILLGVVAISFLAPGGWPSRRRLWPARNEWNLAAVVREGGQPFAYSRSAGFCGFTASWCLSCQVNERVRWGNGGRAGFSVQECSFDEG